MTIAGKLFLEIDIDFTGKETTEHRQQYLEDIAAVLAYEYREEIALAGPAEFYCIAGSRMQFMDFTDFEILQIGVKAKANRFLNETAKIKTTVEE